VFALSVDQLAEPLALITGAATTSDVRSAVTTNQPQPQAYRDKVGRSQPKEQIRKPNSENAKGIENVSPRNDDDENEDESNDSDIPASHARQDQRTGISAQATGMGNMKLGMTPGTDLRSNDSCARRPTDEQQRATLRPKQLAQECRRAVIPQIASGCLDRTRTKAGSQRSNIEPLTNPSRTQQSPSASTQRIRILFMSAARRSGVYRFFERRTNLDPYLRQRAIARHRCPGTSLRPILTFSTSATGEAGQLR